MTTPAPFTPWYVPGWTAQKSYPTDTAIIINGPNYLPLDVPLVTVTANYVMITGYLAGGIVKFSLLSSALDIGSSTLLLPLPIIGEIISGALSVRIPAGYSYRVKEIMPGGRTWKVNIPANQTTPVDINSLPKV